MKIGLLIYGSLNTLSGGYFYDRKLVEYLRDHGDTVKIISLPWRNYLAHLGDNYSFRLPPGLDMVIQDELNHPSLLRANQQPHPYPIISLVHHLRISEQRMPHANALYKLVEKRYLESVDGFIFNSQTTKKVVTGLVGDSRPSIVAYPPTDRFGPGLPTAEVIARAAQSPPLRIIFLGNVIRRKGLHTLIDAISILKHQNLPISLDVVGSLKFSPAYARAMKLQAPEMGAEALVTFHGPLNNEKLAEKLRQAHLLIVPSSYEGFGIVYLEGMGFGLPAIGTSAGAASEIIAHGQTGFIIPPEDAAALAGHIRNLASDSGLLERMSLSALERYRAQPTWAETAGNIRQFLLGFL